MLGHQVVGIVKSVGLPTKPHEQAHGLQIGDRVGAAWIASACGKCNHCLSGNENLCAEFKATGRDIDGGYAEYMKVRADFVHPIPESFSDSEAAPLLCAGAIDQNPPTELDTVIDTTPVWGPIIEALKHLSSGGRVIVNAIRKEDADKEILMKLDYPSQLWMEKEIKSVANVTRADVREFLQLAMEAGIKPEFDEFELNDANKALSEMKRGKIRGSKVLRVG